MGIYKGAALCGIYVQWFALSLSLSVFVTVCMHIYTCMYKLHTHFYMYVCINYVHSICFLFFWYFSVMFFRLILVMLYLLFVLSVLQVKLS